MYTQCKYVVLEQEDGDQIKTRENIYVFPAHVVHKVVANRMRGTVVSAGFVKRGTKGNLFCHGRSESLGVVSREKDTMLLMELFA